MKGIAILGQCLQRTRHRFPQLTLALAGGLLFSVLFHWAYGDIPAEWHELRDDGVITLSHARNWVDYGFIGVNPSGGRLEGYSAPVQFFLYAAAYAATGMHYATFAAVQTAVFTFSLGALFTAFFWPRPRWALGLTAGAALILSHHADFLQWHGSGMENPITHTLYLATLLVLFRFASNGRIHWPLVAVVFLATISRIDSVYHVAPLLVIFSVYWFWAYRNLKGLQFSSAVFLLWLGFHLWRWFYFGDLLPNTAYAQSISITHRLTLWLQWHPGHVENTLALSARIFSAHGGYLLLAAIPLLLLLRRQPPQLLLLALVVSLTVSHFFTPFVFGPARLDATRTTTAMAVAVVLALGLLVYHAEPRRSLAAVLLLCLPAGLLAYQFNAVAPHHRCCGTEDFDANRRAFVRMAADEQLPRPTVAMADLGVLSWHKQFNVVDLGMLGSPILAKLDNPALISEYFFEYAAPDFIESHHAWSCRYYESIFSDPRFAQRYAAAKAQTVRWNDCKHPDLPMGLWVRKAIQRGARTAERRLIDDLRETLSAARLREELARCQMQQANRCAYVARTAFRFLPEFRRQGAMEELNALFAGSASRGFDRYLVNGYRDGQAHRQAMDHLAKAYVRQTIPIARLGPPLIRSDFHVYRDGRYLVYVAAHCDEGQTAARFFLHVIPRNTTDLPPARQRFGYDNLDFNFSETGWRLERRCVARVALPAYAISAIRTGQFVPGQGLVWEAQASWQ